MSLDLSLVRMQECDVFSANYTHNITGMAREAGVYGLLWRPEENGNPKASDLIVPLEEAISAMKFDPARFRLYDPSNNWGSYATFLPWLEQVLNACREFPDSMVRSSR
jgi:hypothetical protein